MACGDGAYTAGHEQIRENGRCGACDACCGGRGAGRGAVGAPTDGIFLDEGGSALLIERNVIRNAGRSVVQHNKNRREDHKWVGKAGRCCPAAGPLSYRLRLRTSTEAPNSTTDSVPGSGRNTPESETHVAPCGTSTDVKLPVL